MTSKSPTILFFGNERLATGVTTTAPTLSALIDAGYSVAAVIVNNENTASRKSRDLEIQAVAELHNIPVHAPQKLSDIEQILVDARADIGVLVAYGKMVPQKVIDLFPFGIVNIHPSLLPLHRGPTPIESVILDGSEKSGVSIMSLASGMDAGPVYAHAQIDLTGTETKQELADTLLDMGSTTLMAVLPGILDGSVVAAPQDHQRATYDLLIQKQDGILDLSKPAKQIEREIRAYAVWPKSRIKINSIDIVITKAKALAESGPPEKVKITKDELILHTANGSIAVEELVPAGKKNMPVKAFLAGYRSQLTPTL